MDKYQTQHKAVPGRPFRTLLRYNLPYWRSYGAGALLAAFLAAVELCSPLVIRRVVDEFESGTMSMPALWGSFWFLLGIAACAGVARFWQRYLMINASRHFEYDLRKDFFRHLQGLPRSFYNRTKTGDIMAKATNDLGFVRMFAGPGVMGTTNMLVLPYSVVVMLHLSATLALYSLLFLPLASIAVYFFIMYIHKQTAQVQECYSDLSSRAQENLAGARVVKAHGAAAREERAFAAESRRYMGENMKLAVVMNLMWPVIGLILGTTILAIVWRGGLMIMRAEETHRLVLGAGGLSFAASPLTLGDLTAFVVCLLMLGWPLVEFGWVITLYQRGAVAMNRISEVFGEVPSIRQADNPGGAGRRLAGSIRFDSVSFAYGESPILEDIDFEIGPGNTLAIVGPTGSGKSTLVSLITREYEPSAGRILFDGTDAKEIPIRTLRESIGFVPQDIFLFSDTIRANMTLGRPDATGSEIAEASDTALFTETARLFDRGFETLLGERGVNLSGGQKQRLTIARALVKDAPILILDDALSSVDTQTEEAILQGLRAAERGRTVVIVSHRVSTVQHADLILVLDRGRIVQRGTHAELIEAGGPYGSIHARQMLEEALEAG